MTICLAPRGTCVEGVFRSRSTCRVFGRASILASPSLERSRMTKMPPAGYPAFPQYLQSGRVRNSDGCSGLIGQLFRATTLGSRLRVRRSRIIGQNIPIYDCFSSLFASVQNGVWNRLTMVIELPETLKTTSSMNMWIKSRPRPPILTRSSWSIGWSNRGVSKPVAFGADNERSGKVINTDDDADPP